jgi:hypothetical protein
MTETLVETLDLDIEESNELLFKVGIEGHVTGPAKVRLVCEGDDVSYIFPGRPSDDGVVQFVMHRAAGMKEGSYPSHLEVMIENRYFVPVTFNINLKKAVKVVAEAVSLPKVVRAPEITVTAAPIISPVVQPKRVVIEGPQKVAAPIQVAAKQKPTSESSLTLADRYKQKKKR